MPLLAGHCCAAHAAAADGSVCPLELPDPASDPEGFKAAVTERLDEVLGRHVMKLNRSHTQLLLLALGEEGRRRSECTCVRVCAGRGAHSICTQQGIKTQSTAGRHLLLLARVNHFPTELWTPFPTILLNLVSHPPLLLATHLTVPQPTLPPPHNPAPPGPCTGYDHIEAEDSQPGLDLLARQLQAQLLLNLSAGSSLYPVVKDLNLDWPLSSLGKVLGQAPGDVQKEKRDILKGGGWCGVLVRWGVCTCVWRGIGV